jgi:hypothetical protein
MTRKCSGREKGCRDLSSVKTATIIFKDRSTHNTHCEAVSLLRKWNEEEGNAFRFFFLVLSPLLLKISNLQLDRHLRRSHSSTPLNDSAQNEMPGRCNSLRLLIAKEAQQDVGRAQCNVVFLPCGPEAAGPELGVPIFPVDLYSRGMVPDH